MSSVKYFLKRLGVTPTVGIIVRPSQSGEWVTPQEVARQLDITVVEARRLRPTYFSLRFGRRVQVSQIFRRSDMLSNPHSPESRQVSVVVEVTPRWWQEVERPEPRDVRPTVQVSMRWRILQRDGFRCVYCGATPDRAQLVVDHVVPLSQGGVTAESNLVAACNDCNAGKGATPLASPSRGGEDR